MTDTIDAKRDAHARIAQVLRDAAARTKQQELQALSDEYRDRKNKLLSDHVTRDADLEADLTALDPAAVVQE